MKEIILQHVSDNDENYTVTFLPENGMPFVSFKKGEYEIIDQSTWDMFHEKSSGLGQFIGPWFYHRKADEISMVADESLFPHIGRVRKNPGDEPFSHGIGHYVPWNYTASDTSIHAHISGMDAIGGLTYASLAGFDFKLEYHATLTKSGLEIDLKAESPSHSCFVGLHTYYALENSEGSVSMDCIETYNDMGTWRNIPDQWRSENATLDFNFREAADYGFHPKLNEGEATAILHTANRSIKISYTPGDEEEHGFQVYHPDGASFACIEPGTAKDFRAAKQRKNHLKVKIEVL